MKGNTASPLRQHKYNLWNIFCLGMVLILGYQIISRGRRSIHLLSNPTVTTTSFSSNAISPPYQSSANEKLVVHQAITILNQKLYVLELIKEEDYSRKVPNIYNGSVGSHLRHSVDHFSALITAANSQDRCANYDERTRNTAIETNRNEATRLVLEIKDKIKNLDLLSAIDVSFYGNEHTYESYQLKSTVVRELSFASHHAIHHMSMVKLILQALSYELPADSPIGIALSTAKDIEQKKDIAG